MTTSNGQTKPRLKWQPVVFAFAGNLLFLTLAYGAANTFFFGQAILWLTLIGPVVAGILTALLARQRGGIHAFIGGVASIPVIVFFILPGAWRTAIFAACFCTIGAAITEIILRNRDA